MNINKPVGPQCIIIGREENRNGRKYSQVLSQNVPWVHYWTVRLKKSSNDKIFLHAYVLVHTHFSTPRVTWEIAPFFAYLAGENERLTS